MAKAKHPKPTAVVGSDDDMREEYDFSDGVRGKYAERMRNGSNIVVLDADVAAAFPNSESVNRALRLLIEVAERRAGERAVAEKKAPYKPE